MRPSRRFGYSVLLATVILAVHANPSIGGPARASITDPDFAAIDAYIDAQMKALHIPGMALAIVHGDQIVHLMGYGTADSPGRPVTPQTPFMLASLAKPMTAIAVMQLVDAGRVELDAPVQRYLPWFRVASEEASAQITVRQLLYHTSGLPEVAGLKYAGVSDLRPDALEQRVRALRGVPLVHPVGTTYEYGNLDYNTLALMIQQVSGQPFEAYMQEHVFNPLGMDQTFTSLAETQQQGLTAGHRFWFGRPVAFEAPFDRGSLGSSAIFASVEDVARFVIPHLNAGRSGEAQLVSAQGMSEILRPAGKKASSNEAYAMDWGVENVDGRPWLLKGGDVADFKTQIVLVPESKWGVVTLINANDRMGSLMGDLRIPFLPLGVTHLLLGKALPAVPAGRLASVARGIAVLILAVQLVWIVWSVLILRRWRTQPECRPRGRWSIARRVVMPAVLMVAVALLVLIGVPRLFGVPLSFVTYVAPDWGYSLAAIGVLGIGWSIVWLACVFPGRTVQWATEGM